MKLRFDWLMCILPKSSFANASFANATLALAFILAACQLVGRVPSTTPVTPSPTGVFTATPLMVLETTTPEPMIFKATIVVVPQEFPAIPTGFPEEKSPTVAPDPLRFVYPTQGALPVSAWRPALYPVPWAPTPYDHFYFTRPIAANVRNWPVADYRYGGIFFEDVVHTGVDIPTPKGTPVMAAGSGKVVWAGYGIYRGGNDPSDPYGLTVVIRHDFGYEDQLLYTVYGHLDDILVLEGQHVKTGELIGLSGETGKVTGPHLHFEVRIGRNDYFATRNPELWLAPPQGWGVLAGRVMDTAGDLISGQLIIVTDTTSDQNWMARTYGKEAVNSDPFYQENMVVGDLPAGIYKLRTAYAGTSYEMELQVLPGMVTYFIFSGHDGFDIQWPSLPGEDFTPEPYKGGNK